MPTTIIKEARLVNEGQIRDVDLRIKDQRIEKIDSAISPEPGDTIVAADGRLLMPGMIDDQVHFREPGLTHKGNIASESRAAVAGGITSYMEMPNVSPATTNMEALKAKYAIAAKSSLANYAFYLGATEENIDDIKSLDPSITCGVKVFMGASTGDLLVENTAALDAIFRECPVLIATHCESGPVIAKNTARLKAEDREFTIHDHPVLRDDEACYASSSYAVDLAKKYGTQLHVLHITSAKELSLFTPGPMDGKHITAEACVHHLWFCDEDYEKRGNLIKCNPAIKSANDREQILDAVGTGQIDIIATDHAPHTLEEKQQPFPKAPAGLPLVQHALPSLFAHVHKKRLTVEQVVEKVCHNPAVRYCVAERGFAREGYYADLVLVDPNGATNVTHKNSLYHCGWSPFDGVSLPAQICSTWVNGDLVYDGEKVIEQPAAAQQIRFIR